MSEFKQYRRKQIAELREWEPGDDMAGVSVSEVDHNAGSPKPGDMIARNPANHADQWLVAQQYFTDNFDEAQREEGQCLCDDDSPNHCAKCTRELLAQRERVEELEREKAREIECSNQRMIAEGEQKICYLERAEAAEKRVEELEQTTGDLCDSCGWRTVIAGKCVKCAGERAEAEVARLREALTCIVEFQTVEVCKDAFAYDRMVESYRDAARAALAAMGTVPEGE
jgi:hypothetical protein